MKEVWAPETNASMDEKRESLRKLCLWSVSVLGTRETNKAKKAEQRERQAAAAASAAAADKEEEQLEEEDDADSISDSSYAYILRNSEDTAGYLYLVLSKHSFFTTSCFDVWFTLDLPCLRYGQDTYQALRNIVESDVSPASIASVRRI